jgi:RimJ/RimL family protein N-acetyltransferase
MATKDLTYSAIGTRIGIRPWNRRRDRQQIDHWPPYAPALPAHWLTAPAPVHGECVTYAVDLLSLPADRLVGRITTRSVEGVAVLGIALHPAHLGAGLGTEALNLFPQVGRQIGLALLRLDVAVENVRAIRCYERVGFVDIGETWCNSYCYRAMARGLWETLIGGL